MKPAQTVGLAMVCGAVGWWLGHTPAGENLQTVREVSLHPGVSGGQNPVRSASSTRPIHLAETADRRKARLKEAEEALKISGLARRQRAFFAYLEDMTAAEAGSVERLFAAMDRSGATFQDDRTFEAFVERWGELDAPGALQWLKQYREPTGIASDS